MNAPARYTAYSLLVVVVVVVIVGVRVEDRAQPRLPKPCGRVDQKFRFRLISPPPPLSCSHSLYLDLACMLQSQPVNWCADLSSSYGGVRNVVIQINHS